VIQPNDQISQTTKVTDIFLNKRQYLQTLVSDLDFPKKKK